MSRAHDDQQRLIRLDLARFNEREAARVAAERIAAVRARRDGPHAVSWDCSCASCHPPMVVDAPPFDDGDDATDRLTPAGAGFYEATGFLLCLVSAIAVVVAFVLYVAPFVRGMLHD